MSAPLRPPGRERNPIIGDQPTSIITVPGESAYEEWLDQGNIGTEQDFLRSLIGPAIGPAGGDLGGAYPNPTVLQAQPGFTVGTIPPILEGDPRLSDSRTPTGLAGGDLTGVYPNPTVQQSQPGFTVGGIAPILEGDARLTDSRTPIGIAGGDLDGTYPNPTVPALATLAPLSTPSLTGQVTITAPDTLTRGLLVKPALANPTADIATFVSHPTTGSGVHIFRASGNDTSLQVKSTNGGAVSALLATSGNVFTALSTATLINSTSTTTSPVIIRGAPSGTADLFSLQDGTPATKINVNSAGSAFFRSNVSINTNGAALGAALDVSTNSAGTSPLLVKLAVGQSAFAAQVRDSSNAIISGIMPSGAFAGGNGQAVELWSGAPSTTTRLGRMMSSSAYGLVGAASMAMVGEAARPVMIASADPGTDALVVRGAAAQTSNLETWQDVAGTTLAMMSADGALRVPNVTDIAGTGPYLSLGTQDLWALNRSATQVPFKIKGFAAQTGDLQEWQDSTGAVLANMDSTGLLNAKAVRATANVSSAFGGGGSAGVILTVNTNTATNIALVAKGSASQTSNLTEWRDSTGTTVAAVGPLGNQVVTSTKGFAVGNIAPSGYTAAIAPIAATAIGLVVRGASGQSVDLFEAQNSSGTVIAKIDQNGSIISVSGAVRAIYAHDPNATWPYISLADGSSGFGAASGTIGPIARTPSQIPWAVRGAVGQTNDLQQWQVSTTPLFAITSAGRPKWMSNALTQTTVGAAGVGAALPATPSKYLQVVDDTGATLVVPAYASV